MARWPWESSLHISEHDLDTRYECNYCNIAKCVCCTAAISDCDTNEKQTQNHDRASTSQRQSK